MPPYASSTRKWRLSLERGDDTRITRTGDASADQKWTQQGRKFGTSRAAGLREDRFDLRVNGFWGEASTAGDVRRRLAVDQFSGHLRFGAREAEGLAYERDVEL